jgi:hypothetical protein
MCAGSPSPFRLPSEDGTAWKSEEKYLWTCSREWTSSQRRRSDPVGVGWPIRMDDVPNLRVGTVFLHSGPRAGRRAVQSAKTPGDRRESAEVSLVAPSEPSLKCGQCDGPQR